MNLSLLPCVRSPSPRVCALPPPVCSLSLLPCVRSLSSRVCALSPPVCALSLLPCVRSLSSHVCALSPPVCALSLLPCVRSLSSRVCALSPPMCVLSLIPCVRSLSSRVCALPPPVCALSLLPCVRSLSSRVCALLFPSGRLADAETVMVGWTYSRWSPEIASSPPVCALSPFPLSVPPGRQDDAGGLEVIPLSSFRLECSTPVCARASPSPRRPLSTLLAWLQDAKTVLVGWTHYRWTH
ncbi:unnamed protein product [Closterium sp. Naga37s-1]|nr:unnamed protein product [Closterium sp. Naga37s-1]